MKNDDEQNSLMVAVIGIIPVIWFALLVAPYLSSGLMGILDGVPEAMNHPFSIRLCGDSVKTVLIFLLSYGMGIGIYISTKKHYRRGEEHGSAKWGDVKKINRRYREKRFTKNKLLTMHVRISYNMRKHLRNVLTVVIGGSGSGKTRFFAKPNLMQANTSFVVLDPKGENLRDTGYLLEEKGYEVRVLDLINMEKSHCYNPFVYLKDDNDVQRLVTNLFKATTPKGSQSNDPFWDTAASMLLLALIFFLRYEAPEEDLDLPSLGERKVALFALIPDNDTSYNFLVSILYTQLFQQLFYLADHKYGGRLPVHVHFLMDEFANVSLPDDFDKILSVMRSREVSVSIILQNLAQLKALFEKQWESIMGNCDEFLYLGGNEQGTHKYVSELLGKATIDTNTYGKSTGHSGNYSTNYQNTGRELMTPDEVRMLDNRYAILFIRGERPILDEKFDILKHPNVGLTTDGNGKPYLHGAVDRAVASISLGDSLEGELTDDSLESEDYELLSDEDLEEIIQKYA